MQTQFQVAGMTCEACKSVIEDIATDFPEIQTCTVDVQSGLGTLVYNEGFDINKFKAEINGLGKYTLQFLS